jgi:cell division protease FtsH
MVQFLAQDDQVSTSFGKVKAHLAMGLGGVAAEWLLSGGDPNKVTSGAQCDIEMITKMAERAVTQDGFGPWVDPRLTFLKYGSAPTSDPFLGYEMATHRGVSISAEELAIVRGAVKKLVDDAFRTAVQILSEQPEEWFAISEGLLEYETLEREAILQRVNGVRERHGNKLPRIELEPTAIDGGALTLDLVKGRVEKAQLALPKPLGDEKAAA